MELQDAVRLAFRHIAPDLQGLHDAVPRQGRVAVDMDLPLLVAEERIDERHHSEDGEDPPDGFPAVREGDGDVLGHHPGKHQDADDDGEQEAGLDEILEGAADVGHFSRSLRRERTALMPMVYR